MFSRYPSSRISNVYEDSCGYRSPLCQKLHVLCPFGHTSTVTLTSGRKFYKHDSILESFLDLKSALESAEKKYHRDRKKSLSTNSLYSPDDIINRITCDPLDTATHSSTNLHEMLNLKDFSQEQCVTVETFLDQNPSFLRAYVLNHIDLKTLREWELVMMSTSSPNLTKTPKSPIDSQAIDKICPTDSQQISTTELMSHQPTISPGGSFKDKYQHHMLRAKSMNVTMDHTHYNKNVINKELKTAHHGLRKNLLYRDTEPRVFINNMDKLQTVIKEVDANDVNVLLYQLISSISRVIDASLANLYIVLPGGDRLEHKFSHGNFHKVKIPIQNIAEKKTAAAYSAFTRQTILIAKYSPMIDDRFPQGANDELYERDISSVLVQPIISQHEEVLGVMEFLKFSLNIQPFIDYDIEIVGTTILFGIISLHYLQINKTLLQQKRLNEFLLKVTSSIFQDMESIATLIFKIMKFGRKLVNADRASLFLLDRQNQELYASIFDVGSSHSETEVVPIEKEKIKFPIGTGIAGSVASTGQIENIKNAYADERFNRNVDIMTGYHTKTILCMPIYIRKEIIGVMQMVNKKDGTFNQTDEKNFEAFAIYCGLALYHAQLYEKIYRSEKKYKVAMEVLSYHITASQEEVEKLVIKDTLPDGITPEEINNFDFDHDTDGNNNDLKPQLVYYMYLDLFDDDNRLDRDVIAKFILTVRKNYRNVPYHNWTHGFYVAHAAYVLLKLYPNKFTHLENLAIFIASLCHDLDHRGKNNAFMKETDTPLSAIYTTSTMEHHHFNQTVAILQQEGHNIFGDLSSADYRKVLSLIKHCILATDLAQFANFKATIIKRLETGEFNWHNTHDKLLVLAIIMTSCDLCASAKPWSFQKKTVAVIMEEFFQQGDAEKAKGKTPAPLMNRECADQLPKNQVGFIKHLCIPCYEVLVKLLPKTQQLLEGATQNCDRWSECIKD